MSKLINKREQRFRSAINKAKERNRERDVIDRQMGNAAPIDCPADIQIKTIQSAIEAGMGLKDWDCIAEAYAMLDDYLSILPRTRCRDS